MIIFSGHPRCLPALFFTEMWERFSFYGMNALLVLYLVLPVPDGGLGYTPERAAILYGNYTLLIYILSIAGGVAADRWIGPKMAVLMGGLVIAAGHFSIALGSVASLYVGLGCVALGTGFLKPNISSLVGRLYAPDDPRRDAGFSIYYMGINLGAFLAPIACGYLAQSHSFRRVLAQNGLDPRLSWHWGFGAAGVGMLIGLAVFMRVWKRIPGESGEALPIRKDEGAGVTPLSRMDFVMRLGAIGFFCVCAIFFFAVLKQSGSSMSLFADRLTRCEIFGFAFPSSWFQSVGPAFIILVAPLLSQLWLRLGSRQPSSPAKAILGLMGAVVCLGIMAAASYLAVTGRVSPYWLIAAYAAQTMGELCLSPVGLSNVSRLSPPAIASLMMGAWFVAIGLGGKLAGMLAAEFGRSGTEDLTWIFGRQALFVAGLAVLLAFLVPWVRRVLNRTVPPPEA
jgi:POT family proton-dependent oligopeptide transporter